MLGKKEFESIYNLYYDSLCKYLYLFTNDFSLIEDTVQSVFIKLWEDRDSIQFLNIKSYLFIATRTRILNAIRDKKKKDNLFISFYQDELINANSKEIIDYDEFYGVIQKLITKLPEQTQTIYKLSRKEKLKYKEIAKILGISIKTVEKHMSNALKYLNENIKTYFISLQNLLIFIFFIFY